MSRTRDLARAWAAEDPSDADRAELERLLGDRSPGARGELHDRFADRLRFGTAGLRGALGAGPNRMNRAVVRAATAALARWLAENRPGAPGAGVVVGCDARHRSSELADETTAVLAGAGILVHRLPDRLPTPVLAFGVRHLDAAAGVMITASHNPPSDNGYKLYLGDGAQIVPPVDAEIERMIEEVGPLCAVPLGALGGPKVRRHGSDVEDAYLEAVVARTPHARVPTPPLRVVYTPMHGVAGRVFLRAIRRAGHAVPVVVAEQADPDPDFPTVPFPNPEEPGALDLAFVEARRAGADLVVAHDPDGDRLAVAVPAAGRGEWRRLTGDEVGALLGDFALGRRRSGQGGAPDGGRRPARPLVASSIVSSSMLAKIAAAAGATYVATLTGFKWIVRAADAVPGSTFVFGYEEALGYAVGDTVRDKDGIGAALALLGLAGELAAAGATLTDRLRSLSEAHGLHGTRQLAVASGEPSRLMAGLRAHPPRELGGEPVARTVDLAAGAAWQEGLPALPAADVLAFFLAAGARVVVRPSGTEPKLKCYLEVVREVRGGNLAGAQREAAARLDALEASVAALLAP